MSDKPSLPDGSEPGLIHLGTFTASGSGKFVAGVAKLWSGPEVDLLDAADSFCKAADRCLASCKVETGVEMLTVPGAVCAAFACELYLKYIHLKESGRHPRGHDLHGLFTRLSESVRAALVECRADVEEVLHRNRRRACTCRLRY